MNLYKFLTISILVSCFLSLVAGCLLFVSSVFAQEAGISIAPLKIDELVNPGEVLEKTIKVTNLFDSAQTFYFSAADFKAGDESGKAILVSPGSEEGPFLSSWLNLPREGISFKAGEKKEISFTISVPEEVGPGGYYGAVILGTSPPKLELGEGGRTAGIAIGHQATTLVILQVAGDAIEDALVQEFSTDKNFYSAPFKINFLTRVKNLGNVHIKPHGLIEIKNMLGKKIATIEVNDLGANVLPDSIRRFVNSWEGDFGFGRYIASLGLSFGTFASEGGKGRQTLTAERSFWILPLKIIIPLFSGMIFIGAVFVLFLKLYKNKAVKRALREAGLVRPVRYIRKRQEPSLTWHFGLILAVILILILLVGGIIFFLFFA